MKGIDVYTTKDGFRVARVHYTADPTKDPEYDGGSWVRNALKGIPGGQTSPQWRKEMEIDFTAYSGQFLCYDILVEHRKKIVKHFRPANKDMALYFGSLDWGRNNPASYHTYMVTEGLHIHAVDEIYVTNTSIPDFCSMIKSTTNYNELCWISADPSIWNRNQETEQGLRSLYDMFIDNNVHLRRGKSRDDSVAINELLDRWDKLEEKEPEFTISPRCSKLVFEFERLRYKTITTAMVEKSNQSESLIDKDNHAWDDFKYFISTWLAEPTQTTEREIGYWSPAYWHELCGKQKKFM